MIHLQQFDTIIPYDNDRDDLPNCLLLNGQNSEYSIILQLNTNNQRHEWITYLDYAMKSQQSLQKRPSIRLIMNSNNDTKQSFTRWRRFLRAGIL